MSKSIIIGANGYIGRNLAFFLISQNEDVTCFDIQSKSFDHIVNYQQLDITNYDSFDKLDLIVDYIYMFAGLTGTTQGFDSYEKYIDVNEKGLLNLITRMKNTGSQARIIFPSTRLVYKGQPGIPLKEDSEKETKTIYALNKLACEHLLEMYKNAFGIHYTIFRICVPYGTLIEGETSYGTVGFFLEKAKSGQTITLFGDGLLRRTFTHVSDICRKIYIAAQQDATDGKIYNIGGENLTLLEVASQIAQKYKINVEFAEWPELAIKIESGDTIFDSSLLNVIVKDGILFNFNQWLSGESQHHF